MNTEYFFTDQFLNADLLQRVSDDKPLVDFPGYLSNPDGDLLRDKTNPTLYNRYDDNSIVKRLLPDSMGKLIDLIQQQLNPYMSRITKTAGLIGYHTGTSMTGLMEQEIG